LSERDGSWNTIAMSAPRRRRISRSGRPTSSVPSNRTEPLTRAVGASLFPSSVGVAILAAASIAWDARLTGILAGMLAVMGFASLVFGLRAAWWERTHDARVLAASAVEEVYVEPVRRARVSG
jgi:hypothetical protein